MEDNLKILNVEYVNILPLMGDDLKILKVKYLSNHLLDHTQILNSCLGNKPKFTNALNEDDNKWKMTSKY